MIQIAACILSTVAAIVAWVMAGRARSERPAFERKQADQIIRLLAKVEGTVTMAHGSQTAIISRLLERIEVLEASVHHARAREVELIARITVLERASPAQQDC